MFYKLIAIVISVLLFGVVPGFAECEGTHFGVTQLDDGSWGLCWSPVPDSSIGGYRVYRRSVDDQDVWEMWKEYDVILSPICNATECDTGPIGMNENLGRYYYVIRAYDTYGHESSNSNSVEQLVQNQPTYAANMGIRN